MQTYALGLLFAGMMLWATAVPATQAQEQPIVHLVMFWTDGCGHCDWIRDNVLPPLAAQYDEQWQMALIELRSAEDFDRLFALGAALGVPRGSIGVPFLLIGEHVLIGSEQIPTELPGLVEEYLAEGGVGWPQAPGLEWFLPEVGQAGTEIPRPTGSETPSSTAVPVATGFTLATVVLVGMGLTLLYALVRLWQARCSKLATRRQAPAWTQLALPLVAVLGIGVAAYLAYVETQAVTAVCGPIGDCNAVQTSPYASFLGIPVGVLGVAGYALILLAWGWSRKRADGRPALVLVGLTGAGVLFSIYLTYLEIFVIGAVCAWCLASAVLMALLLISSVETAVPYLRPAAIHRWR